VVTKPRFCPRPRRQQRRAPRAELPSLELRVRLVDDADDRFPLFLDTEVQAFGDLVRQVVPGPRRDIVGGDDSSALPNMRHRCWQVVLKQRQRRHRVGDSELDERVGTTQGGRVL
jgi:hypothetical protein